VERVDEVAIGGSAEPWAMDIGDRRMWLALLAVLSGLEPRLDEHHKRLFGINHHEYMVLIMLAEAPGQTAELSSIARRVNSSLSRISHTVRRLESDGYVALARSERDGRVTIASLTAAGSDLLERASFENMAEAHRLVLDALTPEQRAQLTDICLALLRHWRPEDPHPWLP